MRLLMRAILKGEKKMSEFKQELIKLVLKYYPDYEYIEIKISKPPATFPAKVDLRLIE